MARPLKPRAERLVAITAWVLPDQYDALCVEAKAHGVSLSRWCAQHLAAAAFQKRKSSADGESTRLLEND